MFVFLSKFLPLLVYPLSLACILLITALLIRNPKWKRGLAWAAVGLLFLFGNTWVSDALVRGLEWQYLPQAEYPVVDAIVVLGGATNPAVYPRDFPDVNSGGDRLIEGARLYLAGRAPVVILSGGLLPWEDQSSTPAADMAALIELMGVPPEALLLEDRSQNTHDNAVFSAELARPLGIHRILLVTSALHMPRSVPLFENQGFEVIPAPTDYNSTRSAGSRPFSEIWPDMLFSLFPSPYSLASSTAALKEYIGIAVYRLRGW